MNTVITIKAWNRPGYFHQVVKSLEGLSGIEDYEIIVSLDHASEDVQNAHIWCVQTCSNVGKYHLFKNTSPVGCAGNTKLLFDHAFEKLGATRVIHLEDDTVPAKDFLQYMDWGLDQLEADPDLFAVCPFNRAAVKRDIPVDIDLDVSFLKPWFECGGGFGFAKPTWDLITEKGGMFGAEGNTNNPTLVGNAWKYSSQIRLGDMGSWAWPMNQYFRERSETEHLCIFPTVSRTNNIGAKNGRFNPSEEWHKTNIWDPDWVGTYEDIGTPEYKLTSVTCTSPGF